ncbi:MAG: ArsR/SmtB family transcription factor [Aeromicrobium sp.]
MDLHTDSDDDCCTPLTAAPLDAAEITTLARSFKALGDPTRIRLLSLAARHEGGEACVCDITEPVGLSQPTVSHHLKILVDAGLLAREQRGVWAFYSIVPHSLGHLADMLREPVAKPLELARTGL